MVKYQATFHYIILYSGVKSLRIDVPAELAGLGLRNTTAAIRDKVMDPVPKQDLAKGYAAWSFSGESELTGSGDIELVWQKKFDDLALGKPVELSVPRLIPRDVEDAWGQIVLTKAESLDIQQSGQSKGLQPIDPQRDLAVAVPGAALAFRFHDDWSLPATVTRYRAAEIQPTSIDRAVVRMVVTPADEVAVQALYRVQSVQQRLAIGLPEAKFDAQPLRVNGQPVPLQGKDGKYSVPLLAGNADEPFLLELRYTVRFDGNRLELPTFPEGAAVQKVYLCAYLPATQALLGSVGPWSQESSGLSRTLLNRDSSSLGDDALISWVQEGTAAAGKAAGSFLPDGTRYVFSAIRPAAPPDGALRLHAFSERGLSTIVFVVVVLGGVVLLPTSLGRRVLAVGAAIVVLVLAGAFFPTLSNQILQGVLLSAVFIVLVLWAVVYVAWTRPGILTRRRAAAAAVAPAAPGAPLQEARPAGEAGLPGAGAAPPPQAAAEPAPKAGSEGGQSNV